MSRIDGKLIRKFKKRKSYKTAQIASITNHHPRTVQEWAKEGMLAVPGKRKPRLYIGEDIQQFLKQKIEKRSRPLVTGQIYCFGCRKGTWPEADSIRFRHTGKAVFNNDQQVLVYGRCSDCGRKCCLISTSRKVSVAFPTSVCSQGQSSLSNQLQLCLNTDIEGET